MEEDNLLELDEFTSDDKQHHVIWSDGGNGYPIWWCETHQKSYFLGCLDTQDIVDKAYAQNT